MLVTTRAIVISALKYGEADLIVKAYTLSGGLKTYMLKGILKSKKGKFRTSMFQVLTQLEIVANHRDKGRLEYLKDAKLSYTYKSLHTNPVKSIIALFLAEMLKNTIQEEEHNQALYQYLEHSFKSLDLLEETANFHLLFLLKLTRYFGFQPENNHKNLPFFNLLEGVFQENSSNDYCIEGKNVAFLQHFLSTEFHDVAGIKMNQSGRNDFLDTLLVYYQLHIEGFKKPKSLQVLNEIFS